MADLRRIIRRVLPARSRGVVNALRGFMNGPGIEEYVLEPIQFEPDPTDTPRLTLIIPSLSAAEAFGGVLTGLDFFFTLGRRLSDLAGAELRIVHEAPLMANDDILARRYGHETCTTLCLAEAGQRLPVRARELFVTYNWWVALNLDPVLRAQADHFGQAPLPRLALIQEYEPGFYSFSAAHLLAREAFGGDWPIWGVFNSSEFHDYYALLGHRADKAFVFEPTLNRSIRPFLDGIGAGDKTRTVLVYGRPGVPRNAFGLICNGLRAWAAQTTGHRDWRFVSAGMQHKDISLGDGFELTCLGKLSLEEYGQLLRETAVGVSLMCSPHPSYPPLEMAHFGARVLTNSFTCKDLSRRHDNLISLDTVRPEALAAALEAELAGFEADPERGLRGQSHMPDYLSDEPFSCLDDLARDSAALLRV